MLASSILVYSKRASEMNGRLVQYTIATLRLLRLGRAFSLG